MKSRAEYILAISGVTRDTASRPNEGRGQQYLTQTERDQIERARRERITKFWTENGVLPLLAEIAAALKASQLTIDEFRCYLRFNDKVDGDNPGDISYDYITVHVESESYKVQRILGGVTEKRNSNAGKLNINGNVVGSDADLDSVLANALAHPSHHQSGYTPNF